MLVVGHHHDLVGRPAQGGEVVPRGGPGVFGVGGGDGHDDRPVAGRPVEVGDQCGVLRPGGGR